MDQNVVDKFGGDPNTWFRSQDRPDGKPGNPLDWSETYLEELYRLALIVDDGILTQDNILMAHTAMKVASRATYHQKNEDGKLDSEGLRAAVVEHQVAKRTIVLTARNQLLLTGNRTLRVVERSAIKERCREREGCWAGCQEQAPYCEQGRAQG